MRNHLTKDDLQFLSERIAAAESKTSGEIRVVVRHRRRWKERSLSLHDLALGEFRRLLMDRTPGRTGVLILLLLSERAFQIIADEGIHSRVQEGTWDSIASEMSGYFRKGGFREGIASAIDRVGGVLAEHVPPAAGDGGHLANDVLEN
jgi:uncharacterized membrane protein